jgi:hypothetical protein
MEFLLEELVISFPHLRGGDFQGIGGQSSDAHFASGYSAGG